MKKTNNGPFDDIAGRIVTFCRDQGSNELLVGKIISTKDRPEVAIADCSLVIEGRSGKRLSLPSYADHDCWMHDTWDKARAYSNMTPSQRVASKRSMSLGKGRKTEATTKQMVPSAGNIIAAADATLEKRLDRMEKMITLIAVSVLGKSPGEVSTLIEAMHVHNVSKEKIV